MSFQSGNCQVTWFCHLRRRLINFFVICKFWPECTNHFVGFNSVLSNCGLYCADCRALCPGPSCEEWHLSSVEQKKINLHGFVSV